MATTSTGAGLHDPNHLHPETTKVDHNAASYANTNNGNFDVEKGLQGGAGLQRQISIQLSNEQYERLFLQPGGIQGSRSLSKVIGNPTPIGIGAFLIGLTSFACDLMGWAGATTGAAATQVGGFYFVSGIGLLVSGIFELIAGNSFPALVFTLFSGFWLAFGFLLQPSQGIAAALGGATAEDYNVGIALYLIWWGLLVLVLLVASLRTNVVFVLLFTFLDITFWILVSIYLRLGAANVNHLQSYLKAAGAFAFLTSAMGWWLFIVLVWGTTGIPLALPVGDLSNFMSGKKKEV